MKSARNVAVSIIMIVGVSGMFAQMCFEQPKRIPEGPTANPPGDSITVNIQLAPGWNMVSNPVITANDSVQVLFPMCFGCPV